MWNGSYSSVCGRENMIDFKNGTDLLRLCETRHLPISEIMKARECDLAETTKPEVTAKMKKVLEIKIGRAHV